MSNSRASACSSRAGIEGQRIGRPCNPVLGLAGLDHSSVQSRECLGQQGMIGGAALDPPRGLPELRERAVRAAEHLVEAGQRLPGLQARLHRRPLFGRAASPHPPRGPASRSPRSHARDIRGRARPPRPRRAPAPSRLRSASTSAQARATAPVSSLPKASSKRAVTPWVEQSAIVLLAVDLDRQRADVAQQSGGDRSRRRRRRGCRRRS